MAESWGLTRANEAEMQSGDIPHPLEIVGRTPGPRGFPRTRSSRARHAGGGAGRGPGEPAAKLFVKQSHYPDRREESRIFRVAGRRTVMDSVCVARPSMRSSRICAARAPIS